jgi:hypothetical protein
VFIANLTQQIALFVEMVNVFVHCLKKAFSAAENNNSHCTKNAMVPAQLHNLSWVAGLNGFARAFT